MSFVQLVYKSAPFAKSISAHCSVYLEKAYAGPQGSRRQAVGAHGFTSFCLAGLALFQLHPFLQWHNPSFLQRRGESAFKLSAQLLPAGTLGHVPKCLSTEVPQLAPF